MGPPEHDIEQLVEMHRGQYRMPTVRHVVLAGLLACGGHDEPPTPAARPEHAVPVPAASSTAMQPAVKRDPGHCTLRATGAFAADETIPGTVVTKYWDSQANQALVVNCAGKQLRVSTSTRPDTSMPYGPKTLSVGELVVLARAGTVKTGTLDQVAGTIDVLSFDSQHVAGSISLTGNVAGGKVVLAGDFDLAR
jgi:hypothetical protein